MKKVIPSYTLLAMEKRAHTKEQKKTILIYSGELILFALIFITLGSLILFGVIGIADWKRVVFTWLTLFGGLWPIADFLWMLFSTKRRKRNCLLDKILILPVPLCLIPFDIYVLANGITEVSYFRTAMSSAFLYIAIIYLFEGIYHYFKPLPILLEEEEKKPSSSDYEKEDNLDKVDD